MTKAQVISEATPVTVGLMIVLVGALSYFFWFRGEMISSAASQEVRITNVETRQARQGEKFSKYEEGMSEIREDLGEIRGALGIPRKRK